MTTAIFIPHAPWRMPTALVVSLAVHAMLLSIVVGGQAFGLPGLALPWQEKRIGADDLHIQLAPAPAPVQLPVPVPDARPPGASAAPLPGASEPHAMPAPAASGAMRALAPATPVASEPGPAPAPPVQPDQAAEAAQERAVELARVERDAQDAQRLRETELIAIAKRDAAQRAQVQQETARAEEAARVAELARQDALRRAAAQQASAEAEQARQQQDRAALAEAERAEQARQASVENARQAALRDEQARQQLAKQQQARLEQARQEQAKQEQAKQEQVKLDQAKQELASRQQAQQQQAQQQQATQVQATQDRAQRERAEQEAQREERLRAIGRQLNAEAAQRDAAAGPSRSLLPGVSGLRRGWLLGRSDANAQLVQYAETMAQKIELNMTFDMVRDVLKQPHVAPIVTMAIRADGSVEKVTFDVSSGVPAIDAAIRRVIASQAPYAAFPPALARQYDVVDIRRTWNIDTAIRLQ